MGQERTVRWRRVCDEPVSRAKLQPERFSFSFARCNNRMISSIRSSKERISGPSLAIFGDGDIQQCKE